MNVEIHKDSDYLCTGTHKGTNGSGSLYDLGKYFRTLGVDPELNLAVENVTQSVIAHITAATDDTLVTGGGLFSEDGYLFPIEMGESITWNNGDTYKIYKTSAKNTLISRNYVDLSRGWATEKSDLKDGWRLSDIDADDKGREHVFGPGQPEYGRRY